MNWNKHKKYPVKSLDDKAGCRETFALNKLSGTARRSCKLLELVGQLTGSGGEKVERFQRESGR